MTIKNKERIEEILKELTENGRIQMFSTRDILGDFKVKLFKKNNIEVLYAPRYHYVELIGLAQNDYDYFFNKYGY